MNTFMDRVNAIVQKNQMPQNMMVLPHPEPVYPDAGMGALENVVSGAPRQAELMNQPHMLAYINPQEEQMLRDAGGAGIPGPDGIPVYGWWSDTWSEIKSGGKAKTATYNRPKSNTSAYVAPVVTTPVVNTAPTTSTTPTFNTYYDAIDAGYGGKTVNIGGKNVKAVTADGYTGNASSSTTTSEPDNYPQPSGWDSINTTVSNIGTGIKDTFTGGGSDDSGSFGYIGDLVSGGGNSFTENAANIFTPNDGASYEGGQLVDDATVVHPLGTLENITTTSTPAVSTSGISGALPATNSTMEELANLMTPNDGAVYANGQLIDQFTGEVIEAGGLSSTGNTIRGTANTDTNDIEGYTEYGSAPVVNTGRETLANIITPGDQAMYVDGQLVDTLTGASLEGGGYTIDPETGKKDYVYGVSDDFSNNAPVDTTDMTQAQATAAIANQKMRQDIPPSDLAYFGSFLGNSVIPIFGGMIAEKMLMGGIENRQSIINEHTAALEAGATPIYNEAGEYTGYAGEGGSVNYDFSPQEQVIAGPSYDGGVGDNDDGVVTTPVFDGPNAAAANRIFNRYYKGGSGYGLPPWLHRYASGVSINRLLEKVVIDGKELFKTLDGKYIEPSELAGTVDLGVEEVPAQTDE